LANIYNLYVKNKKIKNNLKDRIYPGNSEWYEWVIEIMENGGTLWVAEANIKLNISNGQISGVCKGKNNTAGGFIWKYKK